MDTLSTSISTFTNIPKSNPHLKNQLLHHHHHSIPSNSTTKRKTTKISNKSNHHLLPPHVNSSRSSSPLKHSKLQRPSTGYAVALLDAARRHNAVDLVRRDVRRLSRWLRDDHLRHAMGDPLTDKKAKGEIVKEVVREGRFEKHLGKLVKLLAEKGKVDLVAQVLSEFGRIYDELSVNVKDQVVVLPRGVKMDENQILDIVGRIQKVSGADKVTVFHPKFV